MTIDGVDAMPVERALTKSELAYQVVRRRVLSGEYPPGFIINQLLVASSLGLSTTPLREALRRLNSEGLVEIDAHHNARVASLSKTEARELREIRKALDPAAAGLAAIHRTDTDMAILRSTASDLQPISGNKFSEALLAHRAFHAAVYRASHNSLMIEMLEVLWDKVDRYLRLGLTLTADSNNLTADSSNERLRDYHEHFRLVEAIEARQPDVATMIMRQHKIESSLGERALDTLRPDRDE